MPMGAPGAPPMVPPHPMPPQAPPAGMAPPGMPPRPPMAPPMGGNMKKGGRAKVEMTGGAESGVGRLEKAEEEARSEGGKRKSGGKC